MSTVKTRLINAESDDSLSLLSVMACKKDADHAVALLGTIQGGDFDGRTATALIYVDEDGNICETGVYVIGNPLGLDPGEKQTFPLQSGSGSSNGSTLESALAAADPITDFGIAAINADGSLGETLFTAADIPAISFDDFLNDIILYFDPAGSYQRLVGLLDDATVATGTDLADRMDLGGGNDTFNAGAGDDRLYKWKSGNLSYDGGAGSDWLIFQPADGDVPAAPNGAVVDLTTGTGTNPFGGTLTLTNVENVSGVFNQSNDLRGNASDNTLVGGLAGGDTLRGEGGNDTIVVEGKGAFADGGSGTDALVAPLSTDAPFTGSGADIIFTNTLDLLDPSQNTGLFEGGTFVNFETVTATGEYYLRFDFRGSNAAETVRGAAGPDILSGRGGNDTLDAGDGNDLVDGGSGADALKGGNGSDTYVVDNAGDTVVETDVVGTDLVRTYVTFSLAGQFIENLTMLGSANINATGNSLANVITGNSGNNTLNGASNADTMQGGVGNDTYVIDNAGDKAIEADGQGTDVVQSSISFSIAGQFIESLTLTGSGNISATGNSLDNTLSGNSGNNTLNGGSAGNDTLNGGAGADHMEGGNGSDTYVVDNAGDTVVEASVSGGDLVRSSVSFSLAGQFIERLTLTGSGNVNATGNSLDNTIAGNSGNNTLAGASGADTFVFNTALNAATNVDHITDFATVDTIDLENAVFTSLTTTGTLSASAFFSAAGATSAHDADDRIVYNTTTGALFYDADGNQAGGVAAVQFAVLDNHAALTNADFVVT
jgi:Ca2+-binding RTX toxin-like protein